MSSIATMHVHFMTRFLSGILVVLLLPLAAPAGGITKVVRKVKPGSKIEYADFQGKAHIIIPSGFNYLTGDELATFNKETDSLPDPEEVGILLPEAGDWYVSFFVPAEDPLAGVAKTEVTAHAVQLLEKLREKLGAANKERAAAGKSPLRITGWTHKPQYDKATDRVSWGYRLTDDEDDDNDVLNFETILFGSNGEVVEVMLVADLKGYSKPLGEYKKVVESVTFGSAPSAMWFGLASMADNEKALVIGGVVVAVIVGGGLMFRRSSPENKRSSQQPRNW